MYFALIIAFSLLVLAETTENFYAQGYEPCPEPKQPIIRTQPNGSHLIPGNVGSEKFVGPNMPKLTIDGKAGNDCLVSQSADTTLIGGKGNDQLFSSGPGNKLIGGEQADTFICNGGGQVMDFHPRTERDKIEGDCSCYLHPC